MPGTNKGFTLIELAISVVIIGAIAAVAIPSYLRFVLRAKTAEGALLVKTIYDAELVFASQESMLIRHSEHGDVLCKTVPRFAPVCLQDEARLYKPISKKVKLYYHGIGELNYDPVAQTCTTDDYFIHPKYLGLNEAADQEQITTNQYSNNIRVGPFYSFPESYYLMRAKKDLLLAGEYGVPVDDTMMVTAIGDLDGDHNFSDEPTWCGRGPSPSDAYFSYKDISIIARGMYRDANGEIRSTELIKLNLQE